MPNLNYYVYPKANKPSSPCECEPSVKEKIEKNTTTKVKRISERKLVWGSRLILALIGASLTTPFQFVPVYDPHRHWWPFGPISNVLEGIGIVVCYALVGIGALIALVYGIGAIGFAIYVLILTSLRKDHKTWKEWWK